MTTTGETATGITLIRAERDRQVAVEGYTPEHDAGHTAGDLAEAAAAYALASTGDPASREFWPWGRDSFKPGDGPLGSLVKAGALIAAEIDRIVAQEAAGGQFGTP